MFTVLHSSAGAGKTHALVKQYLAKALDGEGPAGYRHVLALTFTNKAAVEMRQRALDYLEALASGEALAGAQADVQATLARDLGIGKDQLRQRARAMLGHMLHHWSQVAISTIDVFTRRVVAPFANDLRLDHELRMTTEEEDYRAKAVDRLLDAAGGDAGLTQVLVATCEQLLEQEQAWKPDVPLLELSKQLTKEDAIRHLEAMRELDSAHFLKVREALRQRTGAFAARMRLLGRDALEAIHRAGLTDQDLANTDKGFVSYLRKLAAFKEYPVPGAYVAKALANDTWHSGKASSEARAALARLAPMFRSTMQAVEDVRDTELRQYFLDLAILRDLLPMASLNSIEQCLDEVKQEDGVSFFSDLTRKVVGIVQHEPAPFLYERLGERYRHFLVDEFQDTSLMQWHALLPLVENALASGGSVLLVGDAKQAIYRWRNGEARQFEAFPAVFGKEAMPRGEAIEQVLRRAHAPALPLAENRRSARGIIQFNNELVAVLKQELDGDQRKFYDRHEQEPMQQAEGYVEVSCYGKKEKDAEEAPPMALLTAAVADCLADGFRPGDIAVLVRTGAQGTAASHQLALQGWKVVSPDGLRLGNIPQVRAVVHLVAWLHRRTDEHAARAVQSIAALQATGPITGPFAQGVKPGEWMRRWSSGHPAVHARLPLLPLVCRAARALRHNPASDAAIMALVNEVHAFGNMEGADLAGFLEHWERTATNRSIGGNPGPDAIQVMTIHKAKGLEFPVVVIPEAGKASKGGNGERIWIRPDPPIDGLPSALVAMSNALADLGVKEVQEEQRLEMLDQLDILYVALTRAKQRLYLSVPGTGNDFLARALCDHLGLKEDGKWTSGERDLQPPAETTGQGGSAEPPGPQAIDGHGEHAGDEEAREWLVRCEAPDDWDPADPDPYRRNGNALHAILARVRTTGDLPAALAREGAAWGLSDTMRDTLARHLQLILDKPELAAFFRPGLEVRTEATLLDAQGHAHRPDRIVRDGGVLRVLDIKTGKQEERHKEQVGRYMDLLRTVEGGAVEGFLLYMREGQLVQVA